MRYLFKILRVFWENIMRYLFNFPQCTLIHDFVNFSPVHTPKIFFPAFSPHKVIIFCSHLCLRTRLEVIKLFSCSTLLSMKLKLLINIINSQNQRFSGLNHQCQSFILLIIM